MRINYSNKRLKEALKGARDIYDTLAHGHSLSDEERDKLLRFQALPVLERDMLYLYTTRGVTETAGLYGCSRRYIYKLITQIKRKLQDKMKILIYAGNDGVALHRLILPYSTVHLLHPDEVDVEFVTPAMPKEDVISKAKESTFFVFNRLMPDDLLDALKGNVTVICDNDDFWLLSQSHSMSHRYKANGTTSRILGCMGKADYVTVSTPKMKKMVEVMGVKDAMVFPNALKQIGQFARHEARPCSRIRFGIIGSASHDDDMQLLQGINGYLPDYVRDRMQWVLCGFNGGQTDIWEGDKIVNTVTAPWDNVCWTRWERMLTDDYRLIHGDHAQMLRTFMRVDYESVDYYQRVWTKPIGTYATLYDNIDVLVAPLKPTTFNSYKSELKMVEASVKGKGLIISNVMPYTPEIVPLIERGGDVNPEGNCMPVDPSKGVRGFAKAICKIVEHPEYIGMMAENLSRLTESNGKFNLDKVSEDRYKWLKSL